MKFFFEEIFIFVGSIVVGIPLGLIAGIVCWIKFPFEVYRQARVNLAKERINKAKEFLKKNAKKNIWEKHIERMEERKNYDN